MTMDATALRVAAALAARWAGGTVTADNWPGELVATDEMRVILSRTGTRYVLQRRSKGKSGKWSPLPVRGGSAQWAELVARTSPDMAQALKALPPCPTWAAVALAAHEGVTVERPKRCREWAAPDFPGVLAVDENMRAVRDRTGTLYGVQWTSAAGHMEGRAPRWITQGKAETWPEIVERIADGCQIIGHPDATCEEKAARLAALFDGCPERAADGPWPVVKVQTPQGAEA